MDNRDLHRSNNRSEGFHSRERAQEGRNFQHGQTSHRSGNHYGGGRMDDRSRSGRGRQQDERNFDERKSGFQSRGSIRGNKSDELRHMGESPEILGLVDSALLGDDAVLDVIDPDNTDREDLIFGPDTDNPFSRALPCLAQWRLETPAGVQLTQRSTSGEMTHTLRSNFFKVRGEGIPASIFHYNVAILPYKSLDGGVIFGEDMALKSDKCAIAEIINLFLADLDKEVGISFGVAYDGASSLYSTRKIPFRDNMGNVLHSYDEQFQYHHDLYLGESSRPKFAVVVKYTHEIVGLSGINASSPVLGAKGRNNNASSVARVAQSEALQALDVALLSFARKKIASGEWILSGNSVFSARDSRTFSLTDQFVGMMGYHASFRACISGLALVKDIAVTCFLKGGNLLRLAAAFMRCDERDLGRNFHSGNHRVAEFVALYKNCNVQMTYIKMRKKFRDLGLPADQATFFVAEGEPPTTVKEYFFAKRAIRLDFPHLPTVNVGSRQREILVPMELLDVIPGQTRQRSMTGEMSAKVISQAAMKPNDRFRALTEGSFLFPALHADEDAKNFGISNIVLGTGKSVGKHSSAPTSGLPMRVIGTILPPAKLMYGNQTKIEPKLRGAWNLAGGVKFAHPASPLSAAQGRISYGLLAVCGSKNQYSDAAHALESLSRKIEAESVKLGLPMSPSGSVRTVTHMSREFEDVMPLFKERDVRIVVVLLMDEKFYSRVKFLADSCCMLTQCARYSMVVKNIRNFETNLLIKMNVKMGGTNHTLASRQANVKVSDEFQQPPKSISWVFDVPTMVIGIDVNHPDPRMGVGNSDHSVVAVVGSMDGMLSQYCAQISTSSVTREPVSTLFNSFVRLFSAFCQRNGGQFPRHVIVYRDGVADSQFVATLDSELEALKQAIEFYDKDEDVVKIAFVVCQKRHHTRFFYKPESSEQYLNPCVGLCVDARGFTGVEVNPTDTQPDAPNCVVGSNLVEFYLNSHAAVLGTSKPTRYILLYDGIGFKLSELELFTFWLTHLYARCTRSVSIAAPAYYAHWAARRGRFLLQGAEGRGGNNLLKAMSDRWLDDSTNSGMYFL